MLQAGGSSEENVTQLAQNNWYREVSDAQVASWNLSHVSDIYAGARHLWLALRPRWHLLRMHMMADAPSRHSPDQPCSCTELTHGMILPTPAHSGRRFGPGGKRRNSGCSNMCKKGRGLPSCALKTS